MYKRISNNKYRQMQKHIANRIVGIVLVLGNIPLDKDVVAGPIGDVDVTKIG